MKLQNRVVGLGAVCVLLLTACGGGTESSTRTKNSALCYATQEEKDAAVQAAQDAFDAAMGGGSPGDPISDTTVPAEQDTPTSVEEQTSTTIEMESMGGGYRMPAVRAASSGDTTVPPSLDGGTLTPEQQQAQMDLETAENQPLCETSGEVSQEVTCEITFTVPSDTPAVSTCAELEIDLDTRNTAAIEWTATVDSQIVASGVWDSVSENTKVVTFTYTPQSDSGSEDAGGSTVICTGTALGEVTNMYFEDDCADGSLFGSNTADGMKWFLIKNGALIEDAGAILASGPLDLSALTPDTPVSFEITYEGTGGSETTETTVEESGPCTATFTSTGVSWTCTNGALFNVEIEDMSNQGVYPGIYCASEGTLNVAEGQRFWFNFFLKNGSQTFFDGWADEREQNVPIEFTVPEDTEGVCSQSAEDAPDFFDVSVPGVYQYTALESERTELSFFVPGECTDTTAFAINWYFFNGSDFEYSSTSEAESIFPEGAEGPAFCSYSDDSYYGGQWVAEFVGNSQTLQAYTNVPFDSVESSVLEQVLPELPEMPFAYSFDGPATQYNFVLTEETRVAITVNSGQSCRQDQTNEEENGFTDPEIWMYNGVAPWSELNDDEIAEDDNGYHSAGNCSAAYVDETLSAGSYFIWAENDDYGSGDTGTITVNSSVELTPYEVNLDDVAMTTKSVTVPDAMKFQVPAGGAHLVATLDSLDPTCEEQDPAFAVIDLSNGVTVAIDDDGGEDLLGMNACSSFIDVNLDEGEYLMVFSTYHVMFDDYAWDEDDSQYGSTFELKYGFATGDGSGNEIVVEESNDPIPPVEVPQTASLPIEQLKSDAGASVGIADGVTTMVCSSTCVEDLFALEGVTSDLLTVSIGGESVVVKKGATKVRVPVSSGARDLVVSQKTTTGITQVVGSTKVVTAHVSLDTSAASGDSQGGSNVVMIALIVVGLLLLSGAGVAVRRRKTA